MSLFGENEKTLVAKAKQGDEQAFGRIYELYFKKIYTFIFYRISHKQVAEDLAEDVFTKAWSNIKSVKDESFTGWLYSIAKNRVIDHYRKERVTVDIFALENLIVSEQDIGEATNHVMNRKLLIELIKKLTPEQQIIIQLKFIEDLSNKEISELISKSEESIRVLQHRAIQKLQKLLATQVQTNEINYLTKHAQD